MVGMTVEMVAMRRDVNLSDPVRMDSLNVPLVTTAGMIRLSRRMMYVLKDSTHAMRLMTAQMAQMRMSISVEIDNEPRTLENIAHMDADCGITILPKLFQS